ncbi:MAG TPA: SGNH/GDSL hydrolase family protein [Candidatus Acidoferrales bacterium]|nr:SGNH/GDSL hydrolase family protein [Candidatus Acidoferrales bacterium]
MNKDDERILRARKGWNFKEWVICAIILISAAQAVPAILGSTVSEMPLGFDLDRNAKQWIGTWATAAQPFIPASLQAYRNQSLRLIVHTSAGGKAVRIKFSNTYGDTPLLIGAAHIARRTAEAEIDPRSDRVLKFEGKSSTTVPPGSTVLSDPVEMDVPALSDLAVSLFLPQRTEARTSHSMAKQTSYVSPETGDSTGAAKFPVAKTIHSWPFLTGVDVETSAGSAAIVAFGSSLTDGDGTTADANARWTDVLARRLQKDAELNVEISVLNEGIIGNRLLHDSPKGADNPLGAALGQAGLARFERDVLAQAGVRYVIVGLGINDILFPAFPFTPPNEKVSAEDIISGYRQLILQGHQKGLRIIGTTNPPFENSAFEGFVTAFYTPEREAGRQKVNDWIRGSGEFDGVVDLDAVLRDPSRPTQLLPAYDSGDHLHPNDAGCVAEGNAFPLALFTK